MKVNKIEFASSYKTTDLSGKSSMAILGALAQDKFGSSGFPSGVKVDTYFITNIDIGELGGFHRTGDAGGVQLKWNGSSSGETQEEVTAHELGHWQGFPHTFRVLSTTNKEQNIKPPFIWVTENEKGTNDNFMDYDVRRKTWFKFQLLEIDR